MSRGSWLVPAALAFLAVTHSAEAQGQHRARFQQVEEPQWLRLQFTGGDAGIYMEGNWEETTVKESDTSTTYQRVFLAPSLTLGAVGSVYHPNLFSFQLYGDGAYGWSEQTIKSGSRRDHSEEFQVYGNYSGNAQILPDKPLNGNVYSNYGRSYRELDFFTRVTVETLGYGTRTTYSNPWLYIGTSYSHTDEDVTDISVPFSFEQDLVNLDIRNDRPKGTTTFDYTFNQYTRPGIFDSTDHTVSVSDSETLGSRNQIGVGVSATVSHREAAGRTEDQISAGAGLNIAHTERLASNYSFDYDRFESADYTSDSYAGQAAVQHRLYDSLFSSLTANASAADSSDSFNTGYSRQYGIAWAEFYTKRLGPKHRLSLDASIAVVHIDQQSTGRAVNEQHIFPAPPSIESFFLNLPNVIETTIIVTDSSDLEVFTRGVDYEVFQVGSRTEIRRLIGGIIPEGSSVRVDYQAEPTPAASYESHTEAAGFRVDLWNGVWAIYGRAAHSANNAPSDLNTFDITTFTLGTDMSWQWLRAGAEYTEYNSTDSDYWSIRFYQSASFKLDAGSSLTVGLSQAFTEFEEPDREEQDYRLTSTYRRALTYRLRGKVQAGLAYRSGTNVDQTLAVVRPEFTYFYGRTSFHLVYDYEYNLYLDREERNKHRLTLRVRREF